jgi:TolB protein
VSLALLGSLAGAEPMASARGCLSASGKHDRIAFSRSAPGHEGIWTMRADGSHLRRVTTRAHDVVPTWSPDGRHIAFTRNDPVHGDPEIYVVDATGGHERNVTNSHSTADLMPAWSPDGKWIAYHSAGVTPVPDTLKTDDWEIWAVSPDGATKRNVTRRSAAIGEIGDRAAADVKPDWSRDGAWLAFEAYRGVVDSDTYNSEIWAMPTGRAADADDAMQLTSTPKASEWFPAWSPDGTDLAFMRQPDGGSFDIWVLTLGGDRRVESEVRLTSNTKHDMVPTWSADGRRIAFSSDRADGGVDVAFTGVGWNTHALDSDQTRADSWDIYVMNRDGSCTTRVTALGDPYFQDPTYWWPRS